MIAFVTNGGWLDSNTADGMRLTLADEFCASTSSTSAATSALPASSPEGRAAKSSTRIASHCRHHRPGQGPTQPGPATIQYTDIGDYLTREREACQSGGHVLHRRT